MGVVLNRSKDTSFLSFFALPPLSLTVLWRCLSVSQDPVRGALQLIRGIWSWVCPVTILLGQAWQLLFTSFRRKQDLHSVPLCLIGA